MIICYNVVMVLLLAQNYWTYQTRSAFDTKSAISNLALEKFQLFFPAKT